MSIGSFLASAGRIGTGIEQAQTDSELRRLQREQAAGARAEMSRQDRLRQEQLAVTAPDLPPQGLMLGAPAEVVEPAFVPAGRAGVTLTAPEVPTAPPVAGVQIPAGAPAAAPAPVAAPTGGRVMRLDGKVIAPLDKNKPERLGAGAPGFLKIDPNMSDLDKKYRSGVNEQRLDTTLGKLEARLAQSLSTIRKPFVSQEEKQRIEKSDYASDWYGTAEARDYFRRNPEMLAVADKNPLGFFNGLVKANALAKQKPAAAAAVQAAAAPVTGAQTVKVGGQPVDVSGFIAKMRGAESGGVSNPYQTPNLAGASSAYGAYQFTKGTWIDTYRKANPGTPLSDAAIWARRTDPAQQDRMALKLTEGNAQYLNKAGMPINDSTLYLAHFLGKAGAVKLLKSDANAPVAGILKSDQVNANKAVLEGRTVAQVVNWAASKMQGQRGVAPAGGAPAAGGVQLASSAAETPVPVRMDPSNFYLADQAAIPRDMQIALQNRQELARMAGMYQRAGMGAEFTQMRLKVMELDNSLTFLQGMQGIQELALANDPRRLAAVWSQYTGVPVQLQPQTDGTYNVMVNGKVTQRGVASNTIIDAARSSFDSEYRNAQAASASAMSMKRFESGLRIGEQAAKTLGDLTSALQQKQLEGANAAALKVLENDLKRELELQNPEAKVTMTGDGTGSAILSYKDGRVATFTPGGDIEINGQTVKTAPTVRAVGVGN